MNIKRYIDKCVAKAVRKAFTDDEKFLKWYFSHPSSLLSPQLRKIAREAINSTSDPQFLPSNFLHRVARAMRSVANSEPGDRGSNIKQQSHYLDKYASSISRIPTEQVGKKIMAYELFRNNHPSLTSDAIGIIFRTLCKYANEPDRLWY